MKRNVKAIAALLLTAALLLLPACKKSAVLPEEDTRTVLLVDGKYAVSYDLYRYFYLNYKTGYTDADFAEGKAAATEAELREQCLYGIRSLYATLSLSADYGITPEDGDIKTAAEASVSDAIETLGGQSEYAASLKKNYMTDSVFRFMMAAQACEDKLFSTLTAGLGLVETDDEKIASILRGEDCVRIVQVLISKSNGFSDDKNRETAEKVLRLAKEGEDFDRLIANYSNDYSMTSDGYYFTHGYMLEEVEKAAFALGVGEISDLVVSRNGYHIIKRLPKEESYLEKNFSTLKAQYQSCEFYRLIDERRDKLAVRTNELFDGLDHTTLIY